MREQSMQVVAMGGGRRAARGDGKRPREGDGLELKERGEKAREVTGHGVCEGTEGRARTSIDSLVPCGREGRDVAPL